MRKVFWLTDAWMTRLQPFFPRSHGKPRVDDCRALGGIIFINRNGLRWCDAPREYAPPKTLYHRWKRWSDLVQGSTERQRDKACLPGRTSRARPVKHDKRRDERRNRIEIMFGRLKDWRRGATRYDRCPKLFLSAILFAATVIFWLCPENETCP